MPSITSLVDCVQNPWKHECTLQKLFNYKMGIDMLFKKIYTNENTFNATVIKQTLTFGLTINCKLELTNISSDVLWNILRTWCWSWKVKGYFWSTFQTNHSAENYKNTFKRLENYMTQVVLEILLLSLWKEMKI